jgi:hypothetical protein
MDIKKHGYIHGDQGFVWIKAWDKGINRDMNKHKWISRNKCGQTELITTDKPG